MQHGNDINCKPMATHASQLSSQQQEAWEANVGVGSAQNVRTATAVAEGVTGVFGERPRATSEDGPALAAKWLIHPVTTTHSAAAFTPTAGCDGHTNAATTQTPHNRVSEADVKTTTTAHVSAGSAGILAKSGVNGELTHGGVTAHAACGAGTGLQGLLDGDAPPFLQQYVQRSRTPCQDVAHGAVVRLTPSPPPSATPDGCRTPRCPAQQQHAANLTEDKAVSEVKAPVVVAAERPVHVPACALPGGAPRATPPLSPRIQASVHTPQRSAQNTALVHHVSPNNVSPGARSPASGSALSDLVKAREHDVQVTPRLSPSSSSSHRSRSSQAGYAGSAMGSGPGNDTSPPPPMVVLSHPNSPGMRPRALRLSGEFDGSGIMPVLAGPGALQWSSTAQSAVAMKASGALRPLDADTVAVTCRNDTASGLQGGARYVLPLSSGTLLASLMSSAASQRTSNQSGSNDDSEGGEGAAAAAAVVERTLTAVPRSPRRQPPHTDDRAGCVRATPADGESLHPPQAAYPAATRQVVYQVPLLRHSANALDANEWVALNGSLSDQLSFASSRSSQGGTENSAVNAVALEGVRDRALANLAALASPATCSSKSTASTQVVPTIIAAVSSHAQVNCHPAEAPQLPLTSLFAPVCGSPLSTVRPQPFSSLVGNGSSATRTAATSSSRLTNNNTMWTESGGDSRATVASGSSPRGPYRRLCGRRDGAEDEDEDGARRRTDEPVEEGTTAAVICTVVPVDDGPRRGSRPEPLVVSSLDVNAASAAGLGNHGDVRPGKPLPGTAGAATASGAVDGPSDGSFVECSQVSTGSLENMRLTADLLPVSRQHRTTILARGSAPGDWLCHPPSPEGATHTRAQASRTATTTPTTTTVSSTGVAPPPLTIFSPALRSIPSPPLATAGEHSGRFAHAHSVLTTRSSPPPAETLAVEALRPPSAPAPAAALVAGITSTGQGTSSVAATSHPASQSSSVRHIISFVQSSAQDGGCAESPLPSAHGHAGGFPFDASTSNLVSAAATGRSTDTSTGWLSEFTVDMNASDNARKAEVGRGRQSSENGGGAVPRSVRSPPFAQAMAFAASGRRAVQLPQPLFSQHHTVARQRHDASSLTYSTSFSTGNLLEPALDAGADLPFDSVTRRTPSDSAHEHIINVVDRILLDTLPSGPHQRSAAGGSGGAQGGTRRLHEHPLTASILELSGSAGASLWADISRRSLELDGAPLA